MSIYEKLGLKTGINACGTVTRLGGTRLSPEVCKAMDDAAKSFTPMHEFHRKAGEYIAGLLGVKACCITCGAAAGLAVVSAACMTRGENSKVMQLPDTKGMPDEILMLKAHRIKYDQALLLSGAIIREVETTPAAAAPPAPEILNKMINNRTALFVYVAENESVCGSVPLPELIPILKERGIPVLVDAAAELPPAENIRSYLETGADLVVFSGGKEIRGPQSSGLIVGDKELIEACHANCCPNYSIGRSMKVSKENIAGLTAAVEHFINRDYNLQIKVWSEMSNRICESLGDRKDIKARVGYPTGPGIQPVIILRAYIKPLKLTAHRLQEKLINEPTPVYVDIYNDEIVLNPQCLEPEELEQLIEILHNCLNHNEDE